MHTMSPAASRLTPLRRALNLVRAQGIPQRAVAAEAGVPPSLLTMIASGERLPTPDVAARIASALGLEPEQLFPGLLSRAEP
jgi:transcriptional regulator with XRE-family HTH domain